MENGKGGGAQENVPPGNQRETDAEIQNFIIDLLKQYPLIYEKTHFLLPANEVWGKAMFSQVFVCFVYPRGRGWLPSMHHRSHDQHPGGWLPSMHHRSHDQAGSASRGEGAGSASRGRGVGQTPPCQNMKAGGTHSTAMLPCRTNARNEVCTRIGTNFVPVPILEQAQFKLCEIPPPGSSLCITDSL